MLGYKDADKPHLHDNETVAILPPPRDVLMRGILEHAIQGASVIAIQAGSRRAALPEQFANLPHG